MNWVNKIVSIFETLKLLRTEKGSNQTNSINRLAVVHQLFHFTEWVIGILERIDIQSKSNSTDHIQSKP